MDAIVQLEEKLKQYPTLKKFVGEEWTRQMLVSTRNKQHPLYRFLQKDDKVAVAFLRSLDINLEILLKENEGKESLDRIENKLRNTNGFFDTVTEIEWIVYFKKRGFQVNIEPFHPNKGPDFKTNLTERDVYFEVRCIHESEEEREDNIINSEIRKRLEKITAKFFLILIHGKELFKDDISPIVRIIKEKIPEFESNNITTPVTILYFSPKDYQILYNCDSDSIDPKVKFRAKVIFRPLKEKLDNMPIYFIYGEGIRYSKRIKKIITSKINQLPLEAPSVIIIDNTSRKLIDSYDILNAIYGTLTYAYCINTVSGEIVGEGWKRKKDGVSSSRISAVVNYSRKIDREGNISYGEKSIRIQKPKIL